MDHAGTGEDFSMKNSMNGAREVEVDGCYLRCGNAIAQFCGRERQRLKDVLGPQHGERRTLA